MASGDGVITRQEIITDEALSFGKEYRKNVDEAIQANDVLIKQFKTLLKVTGDYRKAQNTNDFREEKAKEQKANQDILNSIKQMEQAERALERIRQEKLKTERELLKIAKENIKLSTSQAQKDSQAEKELEKIKQERLKTEKELARLALENERLNKQQAQTAISNARELERVKQELIKTEREEAKLKRDLINLENTEINQKKRSTTLTMEERVQRQLANRADKQGVLEKMGLIGAYQKLNAKRTEAKKILLDLIASERASTSEIKKAQREFDVLDKKVRKADQAAGDFGKTVGNYKTAFSGLSNLMGAFGVVGGITGAVMLGKSIYETTKQIQAQEIALRMLSETEEVYIKNKNFLVRISEQYGLELMTTTNAYKNYFASAKTSIEEGKLAFSDMQMIFEKVSKSSSMLGLSVEQQEGAFLALSQMLSKGTIQSEELRGQLGERLPGAFEVMAKALNVTTMELGDMLKKGEVMATDVLPKFAIAYEKAIGADQVERVETLAASENRLKNEWTDFVENLNGSKGIVTNVLLGINDAFIELLNSANRFISSWDSLIEKSGEDGYKIGWDSIPDTGVSREEAIKKEFDLQKKLQFLVNHQKKLQKDLKESYSGFGITSANWWKGGKAYNEVQEQLEATNKELNIVNAQMTKYRNIAAGIKKEDIIISGGRPETEAERKKREAADKKAKAARDKAQREIEKAEDERLKKLKESYEAEIDLLIYKTQTEAGILKNESVNEKNTSEERYDTLMTSFQLEEELLKLNIEKQLTLSRSFQKNKIAFTDEEIKDLVENKSSREDITNQELLILEKFYAEQGKLRKANEKELEQNIIFEANLIKKQAQDKVKSLTSKNNEEESIEVNALSIGSNLTDVETYEKAVYEIKRKYLLKNLEDELAVYNQIIESEKAKGTITQEILDKQLELENSIRVFKNESHVESLEKAKELEQRFIEMGDTIKNALVDLTNAIFDNRIQRIDEDIEKTNDQYDKQSELYEGDAKRQKLIKEQQQRENDKLEAKKRKEQHKQAVFNKAMAIADIGWSTAQAIIKAMADPGGYAGIALAIGAGIAGAVQTAAVLATPIPKYKMGRNGGPEEYAFVGDGGVHEVIEHKDGSAEITPNRDTLVKLLEGDTVHSSLDLYRRSRRNKINNDLYKQQARFETYNSLVSNDNKSVEQKLDTLINVLKSKNMSTTVHVPKVDLGHLFWLEKQKNW